ncbi:MAG: serine/threonine-protein kinase [Kofleriaceae bacterium]
MADPLAQTELGGGGTAQTVNERPSTRDLGAPSIPGYRITAILGEGGMGTVYAAEQDAPRRRVAIKVLQSRSGGALARFQAEAEIMARLDHPGIARVLEAGDADNHPFLVMEHVDGTTLDRFVDGLVLDRKLELFGALCEAVQHAHLKGVIHRDLKPANVMVRTEDGDAGRVVVLDFGVARLAVDDDKTPSTTRAGELIGTPLYMSPEQARLRADEVDVRTDVYTLGVMLYELISGELPYDARDVPLPILTCMICEDPPIALAKRDPALAGDLDAITRQALAKDPAQRYQSVAALAGDVQRFRDGMPVSVRVPTAIERLRAFVRRRPVVAATITGSILALATFALVVTYLWRDASAARARTEAARAELESRGNQLILRQARVALGRDPTEALAWLATLTPRDVDVGTAWEIEHEAVARGVARDVWKGHTDEVHWVEALPGGFVSAGYDGRVIVWDPQPHLIFTAKQGRVHLARPSPDGRELAIGADDGDLRIVTRDGTLLARLPGHVGDVQHMAWAPDGGWLVTGDDHGNVLLWPHARAPAQQLAHGTSAIGDVAIASDGTMVVAGDHDGHLWQWRVATGAEAEAAAGADVVQTWTDGTRAAAVDGTGVVHWWRREGDQLVVERTIATGLNCKRAAWASDGSWAVLAGVGGTVTRVSIGAAGSAADGSAADGSARIEPLAHFNAQVRTVAISSDGRWIAAGGDDGSLEARDRTTGQVITLHGHTGRVRHVTFADGGLLSSDSDGVVRRWDLAAIPPNVIDPRGEPGAADASEERMTLAPDGSMLAWVDTTGKVGTWTFADHVYRELGKVDGRATAIGIVGGTGGTVVTGTAEGVVTWWPTAPATPALPPVRHVLEGAIVRSIATGHGWVAVASSLGPIAMFTADGTPRPALAGHPHGSDAVAIDPTGTIVVSGGQDRVICVWRIRDTTQLAALDGPRGDTHFVSVDDHWIVAGSNGGTVLAWPHHGEHVDAAARVRVAQHTGAVTALVVSPGAIVSAGRDATLSRSLVAAAGPDRSGPIEPGQTTQIPNAALAVGVDDRGTVRAVTRNGAAVRWNLGANPVVVIDHGVRDGVGRGARWIEAFDDGTLMVADTRAGTFDELHAAIRAATSYRLPR